MQVDIKTSTVEPVRQAFVHLVRRFGDKVATRYQEATYDLQSETNFHYKPLWDPDRDMYDRRRTAIVMADWYALKDPRQFYYGTYTITRARWQESLDRQLDFVEKRRLLQDLAPALKARVVAGLVPLRHYEWGANTNNSHVAAYGWGAAITQAGQMHAMDRLALAQHFSRVGLLADGTTGESLTEAKQIWLDAPEWQGLRRQMENIFVTRDWFEVFIAQNLLADGLLYPLFFGHIDGALAEAGGTSVLLMTEFPGRWYDESTKWVDAVIKTAASETDANRDLLNNWIAGWRPVLIAAMQPLAQAFLGEQAGATMEKVTAILDARIGKLGLVAGSKA